MFSTYTSNYNYSKYIRSLVLQYWGVLFHFCARIICNLYVKASAIVFEAGGSFVNVIKRPVSCIVHEQNRPTCRQAETHWWDRDRKTKTRTVVLTIIITIQPFAAFTWGLTTLAQVVLVTRASATVANYLSGAIPVNRKIPRIKVSPVLLAEKIY